MTNAQLFSNIPERLQSLFLEPEHPWQALDRLAVFIENQLKPSNEGTMQEGVYIDDAVEIGKGTIIEHGAVIRGPAIIGKNCTVRAGAYIRGQVVTGDNCTIGHSTEIVRSILLDNVRVDHFNYVGNSVLGTSTHFGAGAKIASMRFDEKEIIVGTFNTGRKKFGAALGDYCQLGVNTVIGPGVILAPNTWVAGVNILQSGTYNRAQVKQLLQK